MNRAPSRRRAATIALALVGLLALPLQTALAAPRGTDVRATIEPLIGVVSAGEPAAFDATVTNDGSASIANLRFDGVLTNGELLSSSAPCTGVGGQEVGCALPNLAAGASLTLRFLVTASVAAGELDFTGAFSAEGKRSNPGASRDSWPAEASLEISDRADLLSRWQLAHGSIGLPAIGDAGEQLTTVSVPPVGFDYPALVEHDDTEIVCGEAPIEGIGRTVTLSIARGESPVTLSIAYHRDEVDGRSPRTIGVVHQLDDGTCEFPPRGCSEHAGFCYDATWEGPGNNRQLVVYVELPSNGKIKGI